MHHPDGEGRVKVNETSPPEWDTPCAYLIRLDSDPGIVVHTSFDGN